MKRGAQSIGIETIVAIAPGKRKSTVCTVAPIAGWLPLLSGSPRWLYPDSSPLLNLGRIAIKDFSKTRVLERLLMSERRIENSLFKSQQQLQHLQYQRKRRESQNL
ncbi:MAG: hypothetical protein ACYTER_05520, partial [Planctomycetota bacterium]